MDTNLFTQEDKDFLIHNGYLIFDVAEKAPIELDIAKEELKKFISNKKFNLLVLAKSMLHDDEIEYISTHYTNSKFLEDSHDKWIGPDDELNEIRNYIFRNGSRIDLPQTWLQEIDENRITLFENIRLTISKEIYQYERAKERKQDGNITRFQQYDKIIEHVDSGEDSKRLCVIMFYLNEKEDAEGNGGELILKTKHGERVVIPPYIGTGVILDFAGNDGILRNNVNHSVSQIKNKFSRYTYLSGIAL
jgi:hypothetical protein